MSSWETEWFKKIGNEIMFQAMDEVDPIDPELVRRLGEDTKEKRDERMKKLVGNMRAKTTRSSYGDYPWNPVSLTLGIPIPQYGLRGHKLCPERKFPIIPTVNPRSFLALLF